MFQNPLSKKWLLLIISTLVFCQYQVRLQANTLSEKELSNIANFEQPRVSLKLDFGPGCALEVLINDVPVTPQNFHHGGPSALYIPISHFLVPGKNTLGLNVWESGEFNVNAPDEANCNISLVVWDKKSMRPDSANAVVIGENTLSVYELYQLSVVDKKLEDGAVLASDIKKLVKGDIDERAVSGSSISEIGLIYNSKTGLILKREFQLDIPIYRSKWLDSPIIEDNAATHDSLFTEYQRLVTVLKSGNLKKWMSLNEEKYAEAAKLTSVTSEQLWKESLGLPAVISGEDKGWKLRALDKSKTMLLIYGNGKIATLLAESWSPILVYKSLVNDSYYTTIPIFFRLDKKGHWKIVR